MTRADDEIDLGPVIGPQAASRRVLIVEDERRLRDLLHAAVTDMGLDPTAAPSAEAAMGLAGGAAFALALVDLNLPGADGLTLCEWLAGRPVPPQVVILTGFGDLDAARRAIRLQVVDFLTKPCGMDELENALYRARQRWLDRWAAEVNRPNDPPADPVVEPVHSADDGGRPPSIDAAERELILAALARHGGNRAAAAAELGISVRTIYYRLRQYGRRDRR